MDQAAILISAFCDKDLSDQERQQIAVWLHEDPANVDRLARDCQLHSRLYDLFKEQQFQSAAWSKVLDGPPPAVERQLSSRPNSSSVARPRRRALAMALIAASLAAVAVMIASRDGPVVVAQVTSARAAAVTSDGSKVLAGALLPEGETLRVDRGQLLVTFQCGAKVRVEAPALLIVDGESAATLISGCAAARVPTQAIGFAIHTPLGDVIDLGTEYRIQVLDENRMELHVFDGLVEVRLNSRFDRAHDRPLKLSEGRSTRFDAAANVVTTLEYNESLRQDF